LNDLAAADDFKHNKIKTAQNISILPFHFEAIYRMMLLTNQATSLGAAHVDPDPARSKYYGYHTTE
jgi:hypothetical protein